MTNKTDDTRQLASVETISAITPIPNAAAIEVAQIRGWKVVVKKGDFQAGDHVLYVEVDAALPLDDERFAFLEQRGKKVFGGRKVHVLKTARLRGQYSQGIAFPLNEFPELTDGADPDEVLGIELWEPPMPAGMPHAKGPFPSFLVKTDAERVQNLEPDQWDEILQQRDEWQPTEKVDGSSVTAWRTGDGVVHVASRNLELAPESGNLWFSLVDQFPLEVGQWLQGEVIGPGVQANPLQLKNQRIAVFGFGEFDAERPSKASTVRFERSNWPAWAQETAVPIYPDLKLPETVAETISQADGIRSQLNPKVGAEGIVWTHAHAVSPEFLGRPVFKSISAKYLLKHDR
jgi:RNA ligase (TIGR02306 family)